MEDDDWRQQIEQEEMQQFIEWHEQKNGVKNGNAENRPSKIEDAIPRSSDQYFAEAVQKGFAQE